MKSSIFYQPLAAWSSEGWNSLLLGTFRSFSILKACYLKDLHLQIPNFLQISSFQIFKSSKFSKKFQIFQKISNFPKKFKISKNFKNSKFTKIYYQLCSGMVLQRVECWRRLGLFLGMANLKTFSNMFRFSEILQISER